MIHNRGHWDLESTLLALLEAMDGRFLVLEGGLLGILSATVNTACLW